MSKVRKPEKYGMGKLLGTLAKEASRGAFKSKKKAKKKPTPGMLGTGMAARAGKALSPAARKRKEKKYGL